MNKIGGCDGKCKNKYNREHAKYPFTNAVAQRQTHVVLQLPIDIRVGYHGIL
jgi:hypothetical protein